MKGKPITPEVLPPEKAEKNAVGRPGNFLKLVGDKPIAERIVVIGEYHNAAMACMAQGAFYAIMCGFELIAARAQIRHGNWEKWVEENMPFALRTAFNYMKVAEKKSKLIPNLQHVADFALGVSPMTLPADQRQELIEAVKHATDGDSIRQMYLDLGIAKKPGDSGGANNPHGRKGNPATIDERAELEALEAETFWTEVCGRLLKAAHKKSYGHLSREKLADVTNALRSVTDEIESHLKKIR